MNTRTYKGFKIIKNGEAYYSIIKPSGQYLCDSTSSKKSELIITSEVNIEKSITANPAGTAK